VAQVLNNTWIFWVYPKVFLGGETSPDAWLEMPDFKPLFCFKAEGVPGRPVFHIGRVPNSNKSLGIAWNILKSTESAVPSRSSKRRKILTPGSSVQTATGQVIPQKGRLRCNLWLSHQKWMSSASTGPRISCWGMALSWAKSGYLSIILYLSISLCLFLAPLDYWSLKRLKLATHKIRIVQIELAIK